MYVHTMNPIYLSLIKHLTNQKTVRGDRTRTCISIETPCRKNLPHYKHFKASAVLPSTPCNFVSKILFKCFCVFIPPLPLIKYKRTNGCSGALPSAAARANFGDLCRCMTAPHRTGRHAPSILTPERTRTSN